MVAMAQHSIPEDDWVTAEAETLLATVPGLREELRQMRQQRADGTLTTVDTATVRAAIEASIARSHQGE